MALTQEEKNLQAAKWVWAPGDPVATVVTLRRVPGDPSILPWQWRSLLGDRVQAIVNRQARDAGVESVQEMLEAHSLRLDVEPLTTLGARLVDSEEVYDALSSLSAEQPEWMEDKPAKAEPMPDLKDAVEVTLDRWLESLGVREVD